MQKNKVDKQLMNDFKLQLISIRLNIKPSYLWEISFGDCDHVFDNCKQWNIDLNGLKVIQINDLLFITKNELLLKHLNHLINSSFDAFIDVSPDLKSPQLLSPQQIKVKKSILKDLYTELLLNSTKNKLKVQSIDESMRDMCLICGSLLGYPVIYSNNSPQNGNCLSFETLSHFWLERDSIESIYSFSCPQKFQNSFDSVIELWFESIKKRSGIENLKLKQQIKTLSFVLT